MPANIQRQPTVLPILGLDTSRPAEYLTEQFSPNNGNVRVLRDVIAPRNGITQYGAQVGGTDKYIFAGREFDRSNVRYNVRIAQDKVENYSGGVWNDITGTDLTGIDTDAFSTAIPLLSGLRTLVFTNGVDNIRKWTATGNTADLGGSPPKARYVQEYKTYLVIAYVTDGGTVFSQRVQWSDTDDIEEWTSGNSGAVDLIEDGDDISGLNIFADYLCVHKRNAIYLGSLVSSNQIFTFQKIPTQIGCVANNTIKNLQTGEQVFLSNAGIASFNGQSVTLFPDSINDEIRAALNPQYANLAWAVTVRENNEVWFGIPTTEQNYPVRIYRFNYIDRTFFKDSYSSVTAGWRFTNDTALTWDQITGTWDEISWRWDDNDISEAFPLIALSDKDGYTYYVDTGTVNDNGAAVDQFWDSKDYQLDVFGRVARWQRLQLWLTGTDVDVYYSIDEGVNWVLIGNVDLESSYPNTDEPDYLYFDVVSSKIRFRFQNNKVGGSFTLKQFSVGFVPRENR